MACRAAVTLRHLGVDPDTVVQLAEQEWLDSLS